MQPTYRTLAAAFALPRFEAQRLAAFALGKPRSWLLAHADDALTNAQVQALTTAFTRRTAGEPVAYIEGVREFYGLDFAVNPAVLIPRPETELLVDTLITLAPPQARVLDLGTGSGAIAIALATARRDCIVTATDVSEPALTTAKANAHRHGAHVQFHAGDWFTALPTQLRFNVIVSNPPYIAAGDAHLAQGDLRYEPATALTDGADGLAHYRHIAAQARSWLTPQGWLVLEHGYDQGVAICDLLTQLGYHAVTQHYDEDEGRQTRMVVARV